MTEKKNYEFTEKELEQDGYIIREPQGTYYVLDRNKLYTYADYLTWKDNRRREIYNGKIKSMFSAPSRKHAGITVNISFFINWFIRKKKGNCKTYHAPFDVRLPKNGETANNKIYTVVQPDICVICDPSKLDDNGCIGAPDLVVEALSPSTGKRDLGEKMKIYEEAGVREYWVVFPKEEAVTVFILQEDGTYDEGTVYEYEGKVPVHIFNGLEIDLKEIFE